MCMEMAPIHNRTPFLGVWLLTDNAPSLTFLVAIIMLSTCQDCCSLVILQLRPLINGKTNKNKISVQCTFEDTGVPLCPQCQSFRKTTTTKKLSE